MLWKESLSKFFSGTHSFVKRPPKQLPEMTNSDLYMNSGSKDRNKLQTKELVFKITSLKS